MINTTSPLWIVEEAPKINLVKQEWVALIQIPWSIKAPLIHWINLVLVQSLLVLEAQIVIQVLVVLVAKVDLVVQVVQVDLIHNNMDILAAIVWISLVSEVIRIGFKY